jgi:hypothetical protein
MRHICLTILLLFVLQTSVLAQASAPTTRITLPDGPLQITITGVEGKVQARSSPEKQWEAVTVGQQLSEGAELRTGVKSAVRFSIGPDQVFTLDRLGAIQILKANFESGKVFTDLGMKYGRTRYDIESAEREHDTKVRSPSSVLAVRGTKVSIYDQPPFAPQAVSLSGRAQFRDLRKQVTFGGVGKTKVGQDSDNAAAFARDETVTDPRGSFTGSTQADYDLQSWLSLYGGNNFVNLPVLAIAESARAGDFTTAFGVRPPIGRQLSFNMFWIGDPFSDVDLSVISPLGELVSITSPSSSSSGQFLGADGAGANGIADDGGFGQEAIVWQVSHPQGTYQVRADFRRGESANVSVVAVDDPLGQGFSATPINQVILSPTNPTATGTVTSPIPAPDGVPQAQSVRSAKTTKATSGAPKTTAPKPKPPAPRVPSGKTRR